MESCQRRCQPKRNRSRKVGTASKSDTRWSAHAVALRSMSQHYKTYQSILQEIGNNNLQKKETRSEAMNLAKT